MDVHLGETGLKSLMLCSETKILVYLDKDVGVDDGVQGLETIS